MMNNELEAGPMLSDELRTTAAERHRVQDAAHTFLCTLAGVLFFGALFVGSLVTHQWGLAITFGALLAMGGFTAWCLQ